MLVKFFATYRSVTGTWQIEMPAPANVLELLHEVARRYPALKAKLLNADGTDKGDDVIIMVCGRHIDHLEGVDTPLSESDYVALTPLVAGG